MECNRLKLKINNNQNIFVFLFLPEEVIIFQAFGHQHIYGLCNVVLLVKVKMQKRIKQNTT